MENKNTAPKIKNEEFKIEEIISATSGRTVRGVDYVDNYDKIANALRNSSDYKYDDKKSLVENIYEAFPQYKLEEVTKEFSALMESWKGQDTTFINNAMNAKVMAINAGIPQLLTIKVKEKEVKKQEAAARETDNNVPNNKDSEPKKATLHVITGHNIPWGMSKRHDWNEESPEKFEASLARQILEEKHRLRNAKKYLKERRGVDVDDMERSPKGFWCDIGWYMKDKEQLSALRGKENPSSFDRQLDRRIAPEYSDILRCYTPAEEPKDDTWMDKIDQVIKDRFDRYKPTKKELSVAQLKQIKQKSDLVK